MKEDINKIILKNVEMALEEVDIDGMIESMINSKAIKKEVDLMLKEKIVRAFEDKVLTKYRKNERVIDAWADNKLRELFIELGID